MLTNMYYSGENLDHSRQLDILLLDLLCTPVSANNLLDKAKNSDNLLQFSRRTSILLSIFDYKQIAWWGLGLVKTFLLPAASVMLTW